MSRDDDVADMIDDQLAEDGQSVVYVRGIVETSLTLVQTRGPAQVVDDGRGGILEVRPVDFLGKGDDFPYDKPEPGDRIRLNGQLYEVQPTAAEPPVRQISSPMLRIHTKPIAS